MKSEAYRDGARAARTDQWVGWVEDPDPTPSQTTAAVREKVGIAYRDPAKDADYWQGYEDTLK